MHSKATNIKQTEVAKQYVHFSLHFLLGLAYRYSSILAFFWNHVKIVHPISK